MDYTKRVESVSVFMLPSDIREELHIKFIKKQLDPLLGESIKKHKWLKTDIGYYVAEDGIIVGDPELEDFSLTNYPGEFHGYDTKKIPYLLARKLYVNRNELPPFIINSSKEYITYGKNGRRYITCEGGCIDLTNGEKYNCSDYDISHIKIPTVFMGKQTFIEEVFKGKIKILEEQKPELAAAMQYLNKFAVKELSHYIRAAELAHLKGSEEDLYEALKNKTVNVELEASMDTLMENALSADFIRAGIEKYDLKCLEDVNRGNWELWNADDDAPMIDLSEPLVARNPLADIRHDGIVGIDFGTKSTIVSCQNGSNLTTLLRIGKGQVSRRVEKTDYENPTVMEFIDLGSFLFEYDTGRGRPMTSIEDLNVSHSAENDLKNNDNSNYFYSFFYDIKQWCGDSGRYKQIKIVDQKNCERVLPPYLEIKGDDFDPVEVYAYYLGLYINNMRNGIYLNYVLSFPVAYSKAVREKLLSSFTRGIKRSLPQAVLNDEETMAKFRLKQGVSEPAAYAISALKGYGFDPEGSEKVFYGIFDFGGGTTDFDFGIWRSADNSREESRYDYVINHFGSGGDKFLGGEYLLELLAYEVFKANADRLLKNEKEGFPGISFYRPAECADFPGSEALVSESQEARRNLKQLMEKLRPLWEGLEDYGVFEENSDENASAPEDVCAEYEIISAQGSHSDCYTLYEADTLGQFSIKGRDSGIYYFSDPDIYKMLSTGVISVDLFDKDGKMRTQYELYINNSAKGIYVDLIGVLEKRIDMGVRNFFEALKPTFVKNAPQENKIHIFLAGNSSKSPILQYCFDKHIEKHTEDTSNSGNGSVYFEIYPPLGTEEAIEQQRQRGVEVDEDNILMPTGKTGVAYGLIEGRIGGPIKVISEQSAEEEIKFGFYIGRNRKGKFIVVQDRELKYNEWFIFIDAGVSEFEIYYSTLPEVTTNRTDINNSLKKHCTLQTTSDTANVYVRAVAPTVIEYAVAECDEDIKNDNYICEPVCVELG